MGASTEGVDGQSDYHFFFLSLSLRSRRALDDRRCTSTCRASPLLVALRAPAYPALARSPLVSLSRERKPSLDCERSSGGQQQNASKGCSGWLRRMVRWSLIVWQRSESPCACPVIGDDENRGPTASLRGRDRFDGCFILLRRGTLLTLTLFSSLFSFKTPPGFAPGRKYTRYRGPYLDQLSLESLKAEPRKWGEFFGVVGGGRWRWSRRSRRSSSSSSSSEGRGAKRGKSDQKPDDSSVPSSSSSSTSTSSSPESSPNLPPSYTLPASVLALRERAEENVVSFLPNYLWVTAALVVALAALGGRPLSLVGLALLGAFAFANAKGMLGGPSVSEALARQQQLLLEQRQRAAAVAAGQAPPPPPVISSSPSTSSAAAEEQTPPARAAATVFVYGVAAYTRAFAPLTRGIALGIAFTALHACLRVAATEGEAWTRGFSAVSSEQQRRTFSYVVAGVPFRDVLFGGGRRRRARAGGAAAAAASAHQRNSDKSQRQEGIDEDPRRCLRELAAAARALASAAAIGARAAAAAALDAGIAKVKTLRQQLR